MKKTRKILSLMLTVAMVFSLLGVNAFAAEQDIPAAEETEFAQALPEEAVQESALFENQAEEEPALSETEEESVPSEGLSEDELAFPGKTEEESVLPEVPAEEEPAQQEEAEEEFFLVEEPAEEEWTLFEETEEAEVQAANALGSGVCGEDLTWELSDDGVLTISGTGEMTGYRNDTSPWYSVRRSIISLVIENGVTSIGSYAFYSCDNIKNMSIPNSVTTIGMYAFHCCSSLESISIPESVTDIEEGAFAGCSSLKSVSLPKDLEYIRHGMFINCRSLTSLTIPEGVTGIGISAFDYSGLTELTIPSTCEYVARAFVDCPLTSVTFKGPPPRFDNGTFYGNTLTAYYPADDPAWTEDVRQNYYGTVTWIAKVPVPTGRSLTYTGKEQTGVDSGTHYTISGNKGTNTRSYTATAVLTDKDNYAWSDGTTEDKSISWKIKAKAITPTVKLSATSYTWNGKVKKPTVTVKNGSTTLAASNYKVTYASGRKNVGVYKVTVKMKGNYSGSKTVSFKINPKGTTISTLTAASKAITVKWKKQATKMSTARITGYQIQFATDSKFTKNKKLVPVSGYSKVSKKVTGLKGGKKYYVRIRTYKTISGKKYYSSWSKAKTVTTKK